MPGRRRVGVTALLLGAALGASAEGEPGAHPPRPSGPVGLMVLAQLPVDTDLQKPNSAAGGTLRAAYGDGARLVAVSPGSRPRVLTGRFHSACDPDVSFNGKHILFAGKRTAVDNWNIYEMAGDGSGVRQITRELGNCRSPGYQSTLYTIVSTKPWYQLTFVGDASGTMNEFGPVPATNLYSCKLDGSSVRRLTFNLSSDVDPFIMSDGRLLFAAWQRRTLQRGYLGRVGLFGVSIDGADYALFASYQGRRIKHMPCTTTGGLAVFVETDRVPWDGAGHLSCVQLRRPLHSYRRITERWDGLFHSPSPLPDGGVLVSRRPADGSATHGVCRLDPQSGNAEPVFDDPRYHDVQAKLVAARPEPDGRSSVVTEKDPHGRLYCLDVYNTDLANRSWMPPGSVKRIRVLEGVPLKTTESGAYLGVDELPHMRKPGSTVNGIPPLVQRRILGEIPIQQDGSFNIEVPADTPIELQILDAQGMALRSCGWIWAKNHEPRGCIGCHEDGELVPENRLPKSVEHPSTPLCLPPQRRRTVDFRRDVMPIIDGKCASCHGKGGPPPRLDGGLELGIASAERALFNRAYESLLSPGGMGGAGRRYRTYVVPGRARTSPLLWHVFGRNTSRPWDGRPAGIAVKPAPDCRAAALTGLQKRTLVEWIDMGGLWDGIPGADGLPGGRIDSGENHGQGAKK